MKKGPWIYVLLMQCAADAVTYKGPSPGRDEFADELFSAHPGGVFRAGGMILRYGP